MALKGFKGGFLECPTCDAEVPVTGDEKQGDQLFCPYCQMPLKLCKSKTDEFFLQEDY